MKDIYLVSMVRVSIPENASERLEQVLAFMSQHCSDATLASVAAHFNFHPNTVSGLIKRETGKSFGETLREIRMERALTLLNAREIPVAQVAHLCGYENPSNFYRVFKETFGMTPRVYMSQRDKELAAEQAQAAAGEQGADGAADCEGANGARELGAAVGEGRSAGTVVTCEGSLPDGEGTPAANGGDSEEAADDEGAPLGVPIPEPMMRPAGITSLDGTPLPKVKVRAGQAQIKGAVAPASAVATHRVEPMPAMDSARLVGLPDEEDNLAFEE